MSMFRGKKRVGKRVHNSCAFPFNSHMNRVSVNAILTRHGNEPAYFDSFKQGMYMDRPVYSSFQ